MNRNSEQKKKFEEMEKWYEKESDKKVFICKECKSHTVVNKNEIPTRCCRCGSKHIEETVIRPIPLTFSEIKKIDTLQMKSSYYTDALINIKAEEGYKQKYQRIFLPKAVVQVIFNDDLSAYIEYETQEEGILKVSGYQKEKINGVMAFVNKITYYVRIFLQEDEEGYSYEVLYSLLNPYWDEENTRDETKRQYVIKELVESSLDMVISANMIYWYQMNNRDIKEIRKQYKEDNKEVIKNEKENIENNKRTVINISDDLKIYSYDKDIMKVIRKQQEIKKLWWDVRPHPRRIFEEEDKNLPRNQRRVKKIVQVKGAVKGKEREKHIFGESGNIYKL